MKTIRLVLILAALCGVSFSLHAAEQVSVRGLLVSASSEKGEIDPRLSAYVGNLKRILRAESLRLVGEDSASLAVPANETLSLNGQSVQLSTESVDGKTVLVKARWGSARQDYVVQRGGGTTLLVGSANKNGETQAVLLITR
ncbi:hypothetical protein [Oleiharenicola lentus]|uniref:hypothetical protein n=1 Tax=Oleiharenicola lentus TaxID=2508720 RepID=UPI003F67DD26